MVGEVDSEIKEEMIYNKTREFIKAELEFKKKLEHLESTLNPSKCSIV